MLIQRFHLMVHAFFQYITIFISGHIFNMIGLNHREVATLPDKRWPHYPILGISTYT